MPTTTTRRQQRQQRRDADGENVATIDKILTQFSVLPLQKTAAKDEALQYLIKVCLFLIISKMLCSKIKQINRFNICEKINNQSYSLFLDYTI